MVGPIKSNLEPIDESDVDLESRMRGGNDTSRGALQEQPVFKVEKEKSKEISAGEKDSAYGNILSKIQTKQPITSNDDVSGDAKVISLKTDADSQVQHLVDIASEKGVVHAVKVARHLEDNYVLDTFHDKLLSDELHSALVKRGLLEEI